MIATSKAQMKNLQTMLLLLFFVIIFFTLVFVLFQFIFSSERNSLDDALTDFALQKALAITKLKQFSSENLEYFDIYKIKAYLELKEDHPELEQILRDSLGHSNITLYVLDSSFDVIQRYNIYDYSPDDLTDYLIFHFQLPVLVYNATSRKSTIAALNITLYER